MDITGPTSTSGAAIVRSSDVVPVGAAGVTFTFPETSGYLLSRDQYEDFVALRAWWIRRRSMLLLQEQLDAQAQGPGR
jgi:hypothetical protein